MAKGPQARRFQNSFKDILDQSRCMSQIDPVRSLTVEYEFNDKS